MLRARYDARPLSAQSSAGEAGQFAARLAERKTALERAADGVDPVLLVVAPDKNFGGG
jgi:hypothetical protein